ncbi:MAG: glycerate kinase type-2 family protein, partial [Steroidobacteraceae bacterium]
QPPRLGRPSPEGESSWLDGRPVWAAAIGKAASSMALGAADALGPALERLFIVTKEGHSDDEARRLPCAEVLECGHPLPDRRSLEAGARLLRIIDDMPAGVQPLFLVSGGASSLIEALVPGVTLDDLRRLNSDGLASGLPIDALNARRREISLVKGGRLAARLAGRRAVALFISDVPGDDPAVIGSGVMGPAMGTGTRDAPGLDDIARIVIATNDDARQAVRAAAHGMSVRMPEERYDGDAQRLAVRVAHEVALGDAALGIWGGESVIELPPQPGRGGRNQHLALAAARLIAGRDDLFLLAAGTDGTDGPTADAGALVDGETCARVAAAGLDVDECLRRADSGTALAAAGDLVHTGPTGTNVGDLILGLKLPCAC